MNVFLVYRDGRLVTPALSGSILEGITRSSILQLARDRGNTIAVIEPAELARWEKATADVDEIWLKDAAAKGYDGKKLIEEAKALLKKYAPAK